MPPDQDGERLVLLLRRFEVRVEIRWPVPSVPPQGVTPDVLFLSVSKNNVTAARQYLKSMPGQSSTTVIGIVDAGDPAILEVLADRKICAVVERPLTMVSVLANFAVARDTWNRYLQAEKDARHYRRRALGDQRVSRAKVILMADGMSEEQAYAELRGRAQVGRMSIETVADDIIQSVKASEQTHG